MKDYICINNQKIELTEEQVKQIMAAGGHVGTKLSEFAVGDIATIGKHEMIVLEHTGGNTWLLRKDALRTMAFGKDNNYNGSDVDRVCNEFAEELAAIVGEENIIIHCLDLTADDGLKGYGAVLRKASLRTANMQRKYVEILDKYRLDIWEWLATAFSIPPHDEDNWVKCVSPSGVIDDGSYSLDGSGVRPFCILKSDIFVSK